MIARATLGGKPVIYVQLRSTYFHEADSAGGFLEFNTPERIGGPGGFQQAASRIGFTFNWFFVGRRAISYFNSGNNPERPAGLDQNFPVRACPPDNSPGRCENEWRGWNPSNFTADYTPSSEHPQGTNPARAT